MVGHLNRGSNLFWTARAVIRTRTLPKQPSPQAARQPKYAAVMRLAVKPRSLLNVGRGAVRPWAGPRLAGPLGPKTPARPRLNVGACPPLVLKRFVLLSGAQVFSLGWWGGFRAARCAAASQPRAGVLEAPPAPAVSVGRLQPLRVFRLRPW